MHLNIAHGRHVFGLGSNRLLDFLFKDRLKQFGAIMHQRDSPGRGSLLLSTGGQTTLITTTGEECANRMWIPSAVKEINGKGCTQGWNSS